MSFLAILLKPLAVLAFYAVARFIAMRLKRHIPERWHRALYTPFTDYAQQQVDLAKGRAHHQAIAAEVVDSR